MQVKPSASASAKAQQLLGGWRRRQRRRRSCRSFRSRSAESTRPCCSCFTSCHGLELTGRVGYLVVASPRRCPTSLGYVG
eukprot:4170362-Pyramimonas_sp.AAC.1